jgi:hypothetical protein
MGQLRQTLSGFFGLFGLLSLFDLLGAFLSLSTHFSEVGEFRQSLAAFKGLCWPLWVISSPHCPFLQIMISRTT